jgi:hypothetical protein
MLSDRKVSEFCAGASGHAARDRENYAMRRANVSGLPFGIFLLFPSHISPYSMAECLFLQRFRYVLREIVQTSPACFPDHPHLLLEIPGDFFLCNACSFYSARAD